MALNDNPFGSLDYDPLAWLNEHYSKDTADELKWSLQQTEAQKSAELEAKATHLKHTINKFHVDWAKFIDSGLKSLLEKYSMVESSMRERFSSSDLEVFNRLLKIEHQRRCLSRMRELSQLEIEWRENIKKFTKAIKTKDLDAAQFTLEAMDQLIMQHEPMQDKSPLLDSFRQSFITAVRSS